MIKEITSKEWELITLLRNYRKAYPNGARMLEEEIQMVVDELMDIQYQEEEEENNN
jgi:hypothetical protein